MKALQVGDKVYVLLVGRARVVQGKVILVHDASFRWISYPVSRYRLCEGGELLVGEGTSWVRADDSTAARAFLSAVALENSP